ncbi:uncharacterized protein LOC135211738 [Macrobrachium nipponense]|uniref:uncharacterized protein LOC135211738 n=1 Tax=Macrobrachium nipponense TaxID=159736 RepID=UPI0030C81B5F
MKVILLLPISLPLVCLVISAKSANYQLLVISNSTIYRGASRILTEDLDETGSARFSKLLCAAMCLNLSWCNLWCLDPVENSTCHLFRMYVVAQYKENNMADAITCYTSSITDYVVGAAITGAPADSTMAARVISSLMDGIYTNQAGECYFSGDRYNPFIKLDIGSAKPIRRILIVLQPNSNVVKFYDIEARVGLEDKAEAAFSEYLFFGTFPGPSSVAQEIIFEKDPPVMARYVTIQRWSDRSQCPFEQTNNNYYCMMQLCHLEIG